MKSIKTHENEITLSVRSEEGRAAIDLGLDHLTQAQRHFIFSSVASTLKGGSTGFGMKTLETGEIVIEITLIGPNLKKPVFKAVKRVLNH